MSLPLNDMVSPYDSFTGKNNTQFHLLALNDRIPLGIYDFMLRRLQVLEEGVREEVRTAWWDYDFETGDGAVYGPCELKFVPDSHHVRALKPGTKLHYGAIPITEEIFDALPGTIFEFDNLRTYTKGLKKGESLDNPFWHALARNDIELLRAYDTAVFERLKDTEIDESMRILTSGPRHNPAIKPWNFGTHYVSSAGNIGVDQNSIIIGATIDTITALRERRK